MMGSEKEPGIIPLAIKEIFKQIEQIEEREFLIRVGYVEIHNEKLYDLLNVPKIEIYKCNTNSLGEACLDQQEFVVKSPEDIFEKLEQGNAMRTVGETYMNESSSRSHAIFRIIIESKQEGVDDGVVKVSTLFLVDLAGSERVDQTKSTGERLREGNNINKSLMYLSKVIRELGEMEENKNKNNYINLRDTKLTRILSASLGGNAKTAIICAITPANLEETYSTLS